ncbi:hypothetical protein ACFV9E_10100 [Streptomyces sp. NPDC059835]|uniref:hypothetical protein n=1 Tax=Streptomyces sp. NPDC059835 TaxID=3346967 RepID=UPI003660E05F
MSLLTLPPGVAERPGTWSAADWAMTSEEPDPAYTGHIGYAGYTEDDLDGLHRIAVWAMLRHVSRPPGGTDGRPVRGVLAPPGRPDITRVVLWDGADTAGSVAYDLPLVHPAGGNIPWSVLVAVLRILAVGPAPADGPGRVRDGLGIPVVDARDATLSFCEEPSYDLGDALHSAVSMFRSFDGGRKEGPRLGGFLQIDADTVRLYADPEDGGARVGLDVSLRDRDGRVKGGHTGLMAALDSLVRDELGWTRTEAPDPYCASVHDFTHW